MVTNIPQDILNTEVHSHIRVWTWNVNSLHVSITE